MIIITRSLVNLLTIISIVLSLLGCQNESIGNVQPKPPIELDVCEATEGMLPDFKEVVIRGRVRGIDIPVMTDKRCYRSESGLVISMKPNLRKELVERLWVLDREKGGKEEFDFSLTAKGFVRSINRTDATNVCYFPAYAIDSKIKYCFSMSHIIDIRLE